MDEISRDNPTADEGTTSLSGQTFGDLWQLGASRSIEQALDVGSGASAKRPRRMDLGS